MAHDLLSINFLRRKNKHFFDEFIRWTFTIGRLIIILTETVALSAFLYRFSLDRELIDLHDTIKQKQTLVINSKENERKYRNLQDRLTLISQIDASVTSTNKIYQDILRFVSSDISLDSLLVSNDVIKMSATAQFITPLTSFVNQLKKYKPIQSISIDRVENKTSIGFISITITAKLANASLLKPEQIQKK